jgi:hypothetical protein
MTEPTSDQRPPRIDGAAPDVAEAVPDGEAEQAAAERAKALATIAALKFKVQAEAAAKNGQENGANGGTTEPSRPRKRRFGLPANAPREAPKPRKRRSRWETSETSDSRDLIVNDKNLWPTDVTLPGGITVRFRGPTELAVKATAAIARWGHNACMTRSSSVCYMRTHVRVSESSPCVV